MRGRTAATPLRGAALRSDCHRRVPVAATVTGACQWGGIREVDDENEPTIWEGEPGEGPAAAAMTWERQARGVVQPQVSMMTLSGKTIRLRGVRLCGWLEKSDEVEWDLLSLMR